MEQDKTKKPAGVTLDPEKQIWTRDGKVWIPTQELAERILVIGHCGSAGHRGYDSTKTAISDRFWWDGMKADIKFFISKCLHCLKCYPAIIPRPMGESIHGKHPNEVVHYDYVLIFGIYVLIIRDDLSGFTLLRLCESATSDEVAKHLMEWIACFGIPKVQVSDQGSHFKNQVLDILNERLQSKHHFTVAYSPWSNGSIEIIVKDFETTLKKLRLELKVPAKEWPSLLPLIQYSINHAPRKDKGGFSPVEIMTGLKPSHPLDAILTPITKEFSSKPIAPEELDAHMTELRSSLDKIHRSVFDLVDSTRKRKRAKATEKSKKVNFGLGDYVLVASPKSKVRSKTQIMWRGPMVITEEISDWVFKVETLDGKSSQIVHASRLQFYAENLDNIAESIIDDSQNTSKEEFYQIDHLVDIRSSKSGYEVLVDWLGFGEEDRTWEPIATLYADVPLLLHDFLIEKKMEHVWAKIRQ
jgi:hypothetical protein